MSSSRGVSRPTFFKWRSKYGGATVADVKRLRELEAENAKLKRMYADLALENAAIKEPGGVDQRKQLSLRLRPDQGREDRNGRRSARDHRMRPVCIARTRDERLAPRHHVCLHWPAWPAAIAP